MQINVAFDQDPGTLPAGFVRSISYVINLFDAIFTNTTTIAINIGYGEVDGQLLASNSLGSSISDLSYTTTYLVSSAEYKAMGGTPANTVDGYVGFSKAVAYNFSSPGSITPSQFDFIAVAEHEISEVMGRISTLGSGLATPSLLDMHRFTAPGKLATASSAVAYFSNDNGTTDLGNFNTASSGDAGDWSSSGTLANDTFAVSATPGVLATLSSADILIMHALGYTYNQSIANAVIRGSPVLDNLILGTGGNFAGLGGQDLFFATSSNQLGFAELDTNGVQIATQVLSNADQSPLTVAETTHITSTGTNALGFAGRDVSFNDAAGVTSTYEFNADGTAVAAAIRGGSASDQIFLYGTGTASGGTGANRLDASAAAAGTGQIFVSSSSNDTIVAGAGSVTLAGQTGNHQLVLGGSGPLAAGIGSASTVTAGTGAETIWATTSLGGNVVDESRASGLVFVGGSGAMTVTGSQGTNLLYAEPGSVLTYLGNASAGTTLVALNGSEVIDASGSAADITLFGGYGSTTLIGGSGNDALWVHAGTATLTGGGGFNWFGFANGAAGGDYVITDFNANDGVIFYGYGGAAELAEAFATQTVIGNSTRVSLTDGSTVTFLGLRGLPESQFLSN